MILYWASNVSWVAHDVPVNYYVTYPGTARQLVGRTLVSAISPGSPDFGSRYVFVSWQNTAAGICVVEVEIDPSYSKGNMTNNAATRAISAATVMVWPTAGRSLEK
jgi:hypothetical protein